MTGHTIPKTLEIGILARNGSWSELYVTSLSPNSGPESIFMQSTQVSFYTLIPPLASSMMAPALPDIGVHFGITNPTLIALTLSIFLITFAIGPLLLAPLSEIYGRTWVSHIIPWLCLCFWTPALFQVYHICGLMSLGFNLGCGFAPTTGSLIGLRLLGKLIIQRAYYQGTNRMRSGLCRECSCSHRRRHSQRLVLRTWTCHCDGCLQSRTSFGTCHRSYRWGVHHANGRIQVYLRCHRGIVRVVMCGGGPSPSRDLCTSDPTTACKKHCGSWKSSTLASPPHCSPSV